MVKKMENRRNLERKQLNKSVFIHVALVLSILLIDGAVVFFLPEWEQNIQFFINIFLLLTASYYDIRIREIPIAACAALFGINLLHALAFNRISICYVSAAISSVLLIFYFVNRNGIGIGDVLLAGVTILALQLEDTLGFLFLAFFLAAICGIVFRAREEKMRNITTPFAPCLLLAFVIQSFLL